MVNVVDHRKELVALVDWVPFLPCAVDDCDAKSDQQHGLRQFHDSGSSLAHFDQMQQSRHHL